MDIQRKSCAWNGVAEVTASPLGVFPPKPSALAEMFTGTPSLIGGAIHLPALPGSPHYTGQPVSEIARFAVEEAHAYVDNGFDGVIVENHWDIPFLKPGEHGYETAASMGVITQRWSASSARRSASASCPTPASAEWPQRGRQARVLCASISGQMLHCQ